jgi:uncharacterized protein YceH (UPF0502 family)
MHERRVLGVLVEKAKTTPDAYPLSINALVAGCNQKSNRDPVLNLTDDEAEAALVSAQQKGLTVKVTSSGRIVRWRQALYEAWRVSKQELAILAELLLRGPQTEGELRARAGRMEPFEDLDALRSALRPLVDRRLVIYLTPESRRGTVLTHGFHALEELDRLRSLHAIISIPPDGAPRSTLAQEAHITLEQRLARAEEDIAFLRKQVEELAARVGSP